MWEGGRKGRCDEGRKSGSKRRKIGFTEEIIKEARKDDTELKECGKEDGRRT